MIRDVVLRFLDREPKTLQQLSEDIQIPESIIRSSLVTELYVERTINHPQFGRVNTWVPNPASRVRISSDGVYSVIDNR